MDSFTIFNISHLFKLFLPANENAGNGADVLDTSVAAFFWFCLHYLRFFDNSQKIFHTWYWYWYFLGKALGLRCDRIRSHFYLSVSETEIISKKIFKKELSISTPIYSLSKSSWEYFRKTFEWQLNKEKTKGVVLPPPPSQGRRGIFARECSIS